MSGRHAFRSIAATTADVRCFPPPDGRQPGAAPAASLGDAGCHPTALRPFETCDAEHARLHGGNEATGGGGCASPVPPDMLAPGAAALPAASAGLLDIWHERSVTPVQDAAHEHGSSNTKSSGSSSSGGSGSAPITPALAPSQAPASPATCPLLAGLVLPPPAGAAAAPGEAAAGGAAQRAASAEALWRRAQSFMRCVARSPLVHAALLSLELGNTHPARNPGLPSHQALSWTLAQLMAMHLKAGLDEATEASVLASLWLLESFDDSLRSPATVCLNDYLKHLAAFSQEAVVRLTADWRASFCRLRQALVDAQAAMLKALDWRLRLDIASEVKPCFDLLFHVVDGRGRQRGTGPSRPLHAAESVRELWASHMHHVCSNIQLKASVLNSHSSSEALCTPTKRRCLRA